MTKLHEIIKGSHFTPFDDTEDVLLLMADHIEALEKRVKTMESFVSLSREIPTPNMPSTDDIGAL